MLPKWLNQESMRNYLTEFLLITIYFGLLVINLEEKNLITKGSHKNVLYHLLAHGKHIKNKYRFKRKKKLKKNLIFLHYLFHHLIFQT